jgi:hypothetical protein
MSTNGVRTANATVISIGLIACSGPALARTPPSATPPAPTTAVAAGCGSTSVLKGGIPGWLEAAGGYNNPTYLRYVVAHPPLAAGFLFSDPLRAGHPQNPYNKILWVVRTPRNGTDLTIDGHPLGALSLKVHEVWPANSGPGEIYPDGGDVPSAGCWQFDLRWAKSHAQVELDYVAS